MCNCCQVLKELSWNINKNKWTILIPESRSPPLSFDSLHHVLYWQIDCFRPKAKLYIFLNYPVEFWISRFSFYLSPHVYTGLCLFKCLLKELGSEQAKSHSLHLFDFSPLWVFKCLLKLPAWDDVKSHRLHWFDFSPLWVFKCCLKLLASEEAKSHWLHLFDFSPLCVFKCVFKSPAR